jgi:RND family efflux transporter MFP subunit
MTRSLACAALLLLLAACEDRSPPDPADQSVRPARVTTIDLTRRQQQVTLVGRVEAARSIDLAFEVSGPLHQLPVREGESVQRGQLLAALDQADFALAVREAEVQLRLAEQDLDRKERVLREHGIARSAVDDARSLRELQRVRLQQARQKLADSRLTAPFDGIVAQRFVDNFVNVTAAQRILRLHAGGELHVVANVPEHLTATLSQDDVEDMYATFSFSGDTRFPITFRENRGEADRVAQTIEVSFGMPRSDDWNFMPGMTATVHLLLTADAEASTVLPLAAVVADTDQSLFVWIVDPDTQAVSRRLVRTGATTTEGIVVTHGLTQGDRVVTTGAAMLRDGMRVRPMEASGRSP